MNVNACMHAHVHMLKATLEMMHALPKTTKWRLNKRIENSNKELSAYASSEPQDVDDAVCKCVHMRMHNTSRKK
jgi:hypothetical protein